MTDSLPQHKPPAQFGTMSNRSKVPFQFGRFVDGWMWNTMGTGSDIDYKI